MKMNSSKHVDPYRQMGYVDDEDGYIVWRTGTGGNVELLHLNTVEDGRGCGKRLLTKMLQNLRLSPPYATIFGFCLFSNLSAKDFYLRMGFDISEVEGVYDEGRAYVFSQRYDRLKQLHLAGLDGPSRPEPAPVLSPAYWKERLQKAGTNIHQAIYKSTLDELIRHNERHRRILSSRIHPHDSILDVGCGYGRLLSLMPGDWIGSYLGIDLCPEFIKLAREIYPDRNFMPIDARALAAPLMSRGKYDWGICLSLKYTIIDNCGRAIWEDIEARLRANCKRLLFLEFDETEEPNYLRYPNL